MAGLWGFENVPELYVERHQANPIGESIGGGIGQIFAAVAAGKRADREREMALAKMAQERQFRDAQMGMEREKMASEEQRANAIMAMNKQHNAAQEANWQAEGQRAQSKFDAEQAEKAGVARAAPISSSMSQWKDVLDQAEVIPIAAKWNAAGNQFKSGAAVQKPGLPPLVASVRRELGLAPKPVENYSGAEEYVTANSGEMADAAARARERMNREKMNQAAAGRVSQSDALERIILAGQVKAIIEKAKGGKPLDPVEQMIVNRDPALKESVENEQKRRTVDLGAAKDEIRDLRLPGMPPAKPTSPQPNQSVDRRQAFKNRASALKGNPNRVAILRKEFPDIQ